MPVSVPVTDWGQGSEGAGERRSAFTLSSRASERSERAEGSGWVANRFRTPIADRLHRRTVLKGIARRRHGCHLYFMIGSIHVTERTGAVRLITCRSAAATNRPLDWLIRQPPVLSGLACQYSIPTPERPTLPSGSGEKVHCGQTGPTQTATCCSSAPLRPQN